MGNPALASTDERGSRYYTWGDERFWSVTTIIGGGVPKYLVPWATKAVADLVVPDVRRLGKKALTAWAAEARAVILTAQSEDPPRLTSVKVDKLTDDELAARWLKGAADRIRDAAAAVGSDVHDSAEEFVLKAAVAEATRLRIAGQPLPEWDPSIAGRMRSFLAFLTDWEPEFVATEFTVFNRAEQYAGSGDALMRLALLGWSAPPVLTIVDYKSGRSVYPEVAMQNSAYARGEFIGLPDGTSVPMPRPDAGAVLHLTDAGYALRLVDIGDRVFDAFRFAREVYRWRIETSGSVLLQEPSPPGPHPDDEAML